MAFGTLLAEHPAAIQAVGHTGPVWCCELGGAAASTGGKELPAGAGAWDDVLMAFLL